MLQAKTRWKEKHYNEEIVSQLASKLQLTPLVTSLFLNRGLDTEEKIVDFLNTEKQEFHDPFLLEGMDRTVERVQQAIQNGEQILIFGDYDADGVSSTTVLFLALQELGADVEFYIPNRFTEGYGPNEAAFRWAHGAGFSLIITVDTGIAAVHEAQVAKELGIDLIITDHHEPPPELPEALAIIHPKLEGGVYPFHYLAGVGVAFKVAHALLGRVPEHLLEIAVIGTVADLVSLHGENRLLVQRGLKQMRATKRVGLQALFKVGNISQNEITEESIGFSLAPRINAIGRLEDAAPAVHLLLSEDPEEASELAAEIDELNKLRKDIVKQITEEAIAEVENTYPPEKNKVLVLAKEGWNPGVIGIVASKLVERFYRPTIILNIDPEKQTAKGSARSIAGFDLFANLSDCRELLPHFGGHPMAAGMTLHMNDVEELRRRLNEQAEAILTAEDFIPITTVDAICKVKDVTLSAIEEMQKLAPFGVGNPKPRIAVQDAELESIRAIGSDGSHLKMALRDGQATLDTIGFGFGAYAKEISPVARVSVVGEASINEWNNFRKPQLMVQDIAVNAWQLFDWRSMRNVEVNIAELSLERVTMIYFSEEVLNKFSLETYREQLQHASEVTGLEDRYVVLLDLPPTTEELSKLFTAGFPARIYTLFYQENNHLFSTIPTREHFKWYYSFLHQKAPFSLRQHGEQLCRHKGWSKDTVNFMTQVFFELEFVTIKDGVIFIAEEMKKRDLIESNTYREKMNQLQLEQELVYSTYQQLYTWFEKIRNHKEI
ncbi:single-stranded-DNA-specific exonuclease RecJ [Bacillus sp. DX1.1]|uniref:single-stranded-DNA-specific exonuclease RecJ n=1 Tax=unclassified Bacillus (in: firmicutes) TaxID=185979 RepID=UPI00256FD4DB|nr:MULTISPECIES: single-stranded-DNA-specific exonuclease RecJ [unclassified Bacillus (in: firmicutes)]MDM5156604.1 single-stranded-DNA-specific exonuclease RecJ [Bacillus sp. DX1.1]WJE80863.1 single-stranded-DNA-specific exonuclease RecJ [Bacillus sp. DX3.1]